MAENVQQPFEVPVPLALFGGLVTEMSPSDLPEGVSPDCQDIIFYPGGIASRPGMRKWLNGLNPNTSITYQKTYVAPNGQVYNLFLTSEGSFWVQKPPAIPIFAFSVTPQSYASSVSAFGKELIVFHNTLRGTDIPRIFDGTYFDKINQYGPALPPAVATVGLPSVAMTTSAPTTLLVSAVVPTHEVKYGGYNGAFPQAYYADVEIIFNTAIPSSIVVGNLVTVTGNPVTALNRTYVINQIVNSTTVFCSVYLPVSTPSGSGGSATLGSTATLVRSNNSVQCTTANPHQLQKGFQVQISGIPDFTAGTISSIVINNETQAGIATITTTAPHGLLPGNQIKLLNVGSVSIGGGISAISRSGDVVTVTTTSAHGLQVGTLVNIAGVTSTTYNGQFVVTGIIDSFNFTYVQVDADGSSTGGTISMVWPVTNQSIIPNFYTVVSAPSATTFTVSLYYNDGTWTSGTVTFQWTGTFYVTAIISSTVFQYQQYGPNAITTSLGTVTPYSQVAPGLRNCVVMFQNRQGFITAPSQPVQIETPGGQYLSLTNIPIGPVETVKRIIAFTGAGGSNYFYIPIPGIVNGLTVSTATVLNDNSTTTMLIDFGDPTLFDSVAADITGNNQFQMGVIGPCLGVASYASRAGWFGMRESITNFLNLDWDGGYVPNKSTLYPSGWTVETPNGVLDGAISVSSGFCWSIVGANNPADGRISQPAYQDAYGVAILQPNTLYSVGLNLLPVGFTPTGNITVDFYSPSVGVLASAQFPTATQKGYFTANMNLATPANIPVDTTLRVYLANSGQELAIDNMEIFPTLIPATNDFRWSYVNLPGSVDNETSKLGATDDDTPIQAWFVYRDTLLFLTQTGLHETNDLAGFEPYNWEVRQVAHNCGACGPLAITTGENFSAWVASPSTEPPIGRGLYLYTGGSVYKLSQEVQPAFDAINPAAQTTTWVTNDPVTRRVYVGLPQGSNTAPNLIYIMDYREMDTASEIAAKAPIHISFTGKMICSDLSRKWTRWSIASNRGDILNVPNAGMQFCIAGGNGQTPSPTEGFANSYWMDPTLFTDNDYGQIVPYYTTYFFINHEMEMSFQVGLHRKLYKRYAIYIQGLGNLIVTPYGDSLTNPWPVINTLTLSSNQLFDLGDSLNVIAERCAFKISCSPATGTDNWFSLNKFIVTLTQEPVAPINFGAI